MREYISHSLKDTEKIAYELAEALKPRDVVAFTGGMGEGKTAFIRSLVAALDAGDVASSPTFALVHEYQGRVSIAHFDMYRVTSWDDLYSTGFFDYLESDFLILIEWSENIEGALPDDVITVDIKHIENGNDNDRIFTVGNLKERA